MKKVITRKQIVNNAIVFGFIIGGALITLSFLVPLLGIPLLILFLLVWPVAVIMRLGGIKNIHPFGKKFIERDEAKAVKNSGNLNR